MEKRILLPTDFSKNALNAIRYALELYRNQQCVFYFLNVYQVDSYTIDSMMVPEPGEERYEMAKRASEEGMDKLMDILKLHNDDPKHTYHTISTFNTLLYGISTTIAKKDIDLVVMGTKGATGAKAVLLGTNTVDVMQHITESPVLAIPEEYRFSPPKEIVFPTDYKSSFKRRELNDLIEISKLHHTAIRVLHIEEDVKLNKEQENNKEVLEGILEGQNYSNHRLTDVKTYTGIHTFIQSRESDMIAFVNKKHGFLKSILSKSLVKEIGYDANIPILVLNDH
ncbi:MAG: universal stress protein [Bacteroidota bacterium]